MAQLGLSPSAFGGIDALKHSVAQSVLLSGFPGIINRFADILPTPISLGVLGLTTDFAQLATGSSALTALTAAHEASTRISGLVSAWSAVSETAVFHSPALGVLASVPGLEVPHLTALAGTIETLTRGFADIARPLAVERGVAVAVRGWDEATRTLAPDALRIAQVAGIGRGTVGATHCGILLTDEEADPEELRLLDRGDFTEDLRQLLAQLDAHLPARLDGAWERVSRPGPDAASQAAHSLMELVDHTLRCTSPDHLVLPWAEEQGRSDELHRGSPTRTLRMKFALRQRPADTKIMRMQLRALTELVGVVQEMKHANGPKDILAVHSLIPTVEGLLFFILSAAKGTELQET